jgi:hypothetical protein
VDPLSLLAGRFRDFSRLECRGSSPLYERFSLGVAADAELLELAGHARKGQPVPNLFFGAVHLLLLEGAGHPLAGFYGSLGGVWDEKVDPYPSFRTFCLEMREEIVRLISSRMVQTNAVRRCAALLPAFTYLSRRCDGRPLALVEVGASAGLNLLWDRYRYDYGRGKRCGPDGSPVKLSCAVRGNLLPPMPGDLPRVGYRVGIDLQPVNVNDQRATMWLRALVWPEHRERREILDHAIEIAQQEPPTVVPGDAVEVLPGLLEDIPEDHHLCMYHSHTLNQFSAANREAFHSLIERWSRVRDLDLLSMELGKGVGHSVVGLTSYKSGVKTGGRLAECDTHGAWVKWLNAE